MDMPLPDRRVDRKPAAARSNILDGKWLGPDLGPGPSLIARSATLQAAGANVDFDLHLLTPFLRRYKQGSSTPQTRNEDFRRGWTPVRSATLASAGIVRSRSATRCAKCSPQSNLASSRWSGWMRAARFATRCATIVHASPIASDNPFYESPRSRIGQAARAEYTSVVSHSRLSRLPTTIDEIWYRMAGPCAGKQGNPVLHPAAEL